jgi:hypothetical protein
MTRRWIICGSLLLAGCANYPSAWYKITDEINRTPKEQAESNRECMRVAEVRSTAPAGFSIVTTTFVRPGIGLGIAQPVMATNYELYEMVWVSCMAGRRYQLERMTAPALQQSVPSATTFADPHPPTPDETLPLCPRGLIWYRQVVDGVRICR